MKKPQTLVPRTCRPARPCTDESRVPLGTHPWHREFNLLAILDEPSHINAPSNE